MGGKLTQDELYERIKLHERWLMSEKQEAVRLIGWQLEVLKSGVRMRRALDMNSYTDTQIGS